MEKKFIRYVSQNIFGMLGISAYILADTFFIAQAEGSGGITALNLVLPIYSLIFGIGSMLGVGAAIRFRILRAKKEKEADLYFSNALMFAGMISILFIWMGVFVPDRLISLLGGDSDIIAIGTSYTRIFLLFTPFFMANYICNAFVRNDGNPSIAMTATLLSSLFNIVMDYILMFPCGLGMTGAALATVFSPVVGIGICLIHFFSKKNTVKFLWKRPLLKRLFKTCQVGLSAFIGEMAAGVTTAVFNFLILSLTGNNGVAAFGIVANTSIVATAIFNGVAQGAQPLFSELYGAGDRKNVKKIWKLSVITALLLACFVVVITGLFAEFIVAMFNSENNTQMAEYAIKGVRLYFPGFLFAGFNIVGTGYLSAVESAGWAFAASIIRGVVAVTLCAVLLSHFLGMTGVWLAFPAAELLTMFIIIVAVVRGNGEFYD